MSAHEVTAGGAAHPDPLLESFRGLPVSVVSDAMDRLGLASTVLDGGIHPFVGSHCLGRARTIERVPVAEARSDLSLQWGVQKLVDTCGPGDVIVIATHGETENSAWGGNLSLRAEVLGIGGMVTDGALRDMEECEGRSVPIFARAVNPRRSVARSTAISLGQPVTIGGVLVRPGDIVLGDRDGVVIIAPDEAEAVAREARTLVATETAMQVELRKGESLVAILNRFKRPA